MNQLKIKYAPLDKFKVNERNARVHSEDQVARLAAGIAEFGFNVPVAIDAEGILIYGHARLAAAQKAGLEKIPFVELTHMTEEQKRAYILADNQIANMATWDFDLLGAELSALAEGDLDMDPIGFSAGEIDALLNNIAPDIGSLTNDALDEHVLWPKIEVRVPSDLKLRWDSMISTMEGEDWQKIDKLVTANDAL